MSETRVVLRVHGAGPESLELDCIETAVRGRRYQGPGRVQITVVIDADFSTEHHFFRAQFIDVFHGLNVLHFLAEFHEG
jgi:hypothetical protein